MKVYLLLALVGTCAASEYVQFVENVRQNYEESINSAIVQQINHELQASYLYQAYSHYFARADVALPGFAKWFEKASQEERDHANSLINYVNQRGGVVSLSDIYAKWFEKASQEERDHANSLINYLNQRGGVVSLSDIYFNQACSKISDGLTTLFKKDGRETACICYFMSHKKDKLKGECVPDRTNWQNGLWAMQDTLVMEKYVNEQLLKLHEAADIDPHLSHILEHEFLDEQVTAIKALGDFIRQLERLSHILEHEFLDEQVTAIKALGDYIRQLERVGTGLGEHLFDKSLQ